MLWWTTEGDPFSGTDHAESFHRLQGVVTSFIFFKGRPIKDQFGQRSRRGLSQVETSEEVLCPLPEPDSKRVLRCPQFLEHPLEIIPLQVHNRCIPLRRLLEVHAMRGETQMAAECLILASARLQDLLAPGSPFFDLIRRQGGIQKQVMPWCPSPFQFSLIQYALQVSS